MKHKRTLLKVSDDVANKDLLSIVTPPPRYNDKPDKKKAILKTNASRNDVMMARGVQMFRNSFDKPKDD
jgi:hypothetical protein